MSDPISIGGLGKLLEEVRSIVTQDIPRFLGLFRKPTVAIFRPAESWWYMGKVGDQPAMQVVTKWLITNRTSRPVLLVDVWLRSTSPLRRRRINGTVLTANDSGLFSGDFPLLPGVPTPVLADFWVFPPLCEDGEEFKVIVTFQDQLKRKCTARRARIRGSPKQKPEARQSPPKEQLSAIPDLVERKVATVLKAEVDRYGHCGRRVGGLGSVETTYEGRTSHGIPTQWWPEMDAGLQAIANDPDNASIESDNLEALLSIYGELETDDERQRFREALLLRVSKHTEYAPVGYLTLLVFLRLGDIREVIEKAKRDLQGDAGHGFSDLLILLDGLLRLDHPSFTDEMLDEIEEFVNGLDEHTFHIEERVNAIRALRIGEGGER